MKNSMLAGLIVGGVVLTAVAAYAGSRGGLPWDDYADVVSVEPAYDTKQIARQVCNDETVTEQVPVKDEKRIAGAAIGAVVGGVLGHQVGSGSGNTAATVAGAAAGGYAGSKIQKGMQERNTETTTEERCGTVYDDEKTPAGFLVTYEFEGKQGVVRMDHNPGKRLRMEDGAPVLTTT
jgi:uncharacterized protein YcfJ